VTEKRLVKMRLVKILKKTSPLLDSSISFVLEPVNPSTKLTLKLEEKCTFNVCTLYMYVYIHMNRAFLSLNAPVRILANKKKQCYEMFGISV